MTWDGTERRTQSPDGRRPGDQHCHQHDLLWTHHDEDKKNFRELSCGKISKLDALILREVSKLEKVDDSIREAMDDIKKSIIGKYWFRIIVGFLGVAIVSLGIQQNWAFKEILGNQKEMSVSINVIENKQIQVVEKLVVFEKEISDLNQRQDVLRNAHMKIMEEHKRDGDVKRP